MERRISIIGSNGSLNSHYNECFETILSLYKQFGYIEIDPDTEISDKQLEDKVMLNRQAQIKSLAKGWVLQNAFDRKITYSELLRNVLEVELLLG